MIIVHGTMNMKPETIGEFARDVTAMLEKVRAEDGCGHYSLLVEDPATGLVNVIERWRDEDALKAHLKMPWVAGFFAKHGGNMTASTLQIWDVANPRPLPDM
ncbi:MAG: hypothetical protein RL367_2543 [Pseudomonadota bacterium]